VHAQQRTLPVIGYLDSQAFEASEELRREFRQGLKENGFIEGETVAIETHFSVTWAKACLIFCGGLTMRCRAPAISQAPFAIASASMSM
jgi:hypothetical protein